MFYSKLYIGEADLAKDGSNYEVAIVNGIIDAYPQINCRLTRRKSGIKQHNGQNPDVNSSEEADYSKGNQSEEKNSEDNNSTINTEKNNYHRRCRRKTV
ncbi:MAG: hypothetical protein K6C35_01870 [Eubacterium sp.]|nr:hypothetical protein [Eubacterium sp.]